MPMTKSEPYPIGNSNGSSAKIVLVSFNGDNVQSDDVEERMREENMRPARDEELDDFNNAHPAVCNDRLVVGLGTVKSQGGYRVVPCLDAGSPRRIYAEYRKRSWPIGTCFAAIPLG
ncbi:MAG: hypothetical protein ABIH36_00525 [bacterium]